MNTPDSIFPKHSTMLQVLNIYPDEVEMNLEEEGATKIGVRQSHIESFAFSSHQKPVYKPRLPSRYAKIFDTLKVLNRQGDTHTMIYLKEENDLCKMVLQVPYKRKHARMRTIIVPFPKEEWANAQEVLLVHGLTMVKVEERRSILYTYTPLHARYEIIMFPGIPAYVEMYSPYKEKMPEVVAVAGFSIDETQSLSKEELLARYQVDPDHLVFE